MPVHCNTLLSGRGARMLANHRPLILSWFCTGRCHSSGAVDGLHFKAKLALRRAFGCHTYHACQLALYVTFPIPPMPTSPADELSEHPALTKHWQARSRSYEASSVRNRESAG